MGRDDDRRDKALDTASEGAPAGSTRKDLGPVPQRMLEGYRRECAGLKNVSRFGAMAEDGKNFVVYDCNCYERNTA